MAAVKGVDLGWTAIFEDVEGWEREGLRAVAALEARRMGERRAKALC